MTGREGDQQRGSAPSLWLAPRGWGGCGAGRDFTVGL